MITDALITTPALISPIVPAEDPPAAAEDWSLIPEADRPPEIEDWLNVPAWGRIKIAWLVAGFVLVNRLEALLARF